MTKPRRVALALLATFGVLLPAERASAWLLEQAAPAGPDSVQLTHFYPYASSYTQIDEGFAFDDDPLRGLPNAPYIMPIVVQPPPDRQALVLPRMTFVEEMCRSTEAL